MSVYQSRSGFFGKNISGWLYKITYNACLDKIKSKKRRRLFFFNDINEEPAVYMEDIFSMPEIMEALKPLKPNERALLYGRIMNGQSYEELSQIMDSNPAALRKQYERVKKKAAKYLKASGYCSDPALELVYDGRRHKS
jgi:RNA polymerase sigma-70 factor (ECF subfamily)